MTLTILTRPRAKKLAVLYDLSLILIGSWLIALAAQIAVSLPFSPVPISGQTFAVLFVGALLGRRLAALTVTAYLTQGLLGLPVFAGGTSGLSRLVGPTGGYLLGFWLAAFCVGYLAERGWTLSVGKTLLAMISGNVLIYLCGVSYLSLFLGFERAIMAGLYPFLVGDVIKILLATLLLPLGWKVLARV
ncbi:MAG: biotin transporter BioY [Anaerolineales bacterium]